MRLFLALMFLIIITIKGFGQDFISNSNALNHSKLPLDTSVLGRWPYIASVNINKNGSYASYRVQNTPEGGSTIIIKAIDSNWSRELIGISDVKLLESKALYERNDSLYLLELGTNETIFVNSVKKYEVVHEKSAWLALLLKNETDDLVLKNLHTGKEIRISNVTDFNFNNTGDKLLVKCHLVNNSSYSYLKYISLLDYNDKTIWTSDSLEKNIVKEFMFDKASNQVTFLVENKEGLRSIWYYNDSLDNCELIVNNKSFEKLFISKLVGFSNNGKWIFFQLQSFKDTLTKKKEGVSVDIWSYKDIIINPDQVWRLNGAESKRFMAVVGVRSKSLIRIEYDNEELITHPKQITGDFAVIMDQKFVQEYWWKLDAQPTFYLLSLFDGSKKVLKKESKSLNNFCFSPNGNYLVYFDWMQKHYYCLDIKSGNVYNVTRSLPLPVYKDHNFGRINYAVAPVAGWLENDEALLVYDNYDIWMLDPKNKKNPINVTNGYGASHKIKFRIAKEDDLIRTYKVKDSLLLTAFNVQNKYNGLYLKRLNENNKAPVEMIMGPFTIFRAESQKAHNYSFDDGMEPLKANDANVWIIKFQTARDAPNVYFSKNLRDFNILSNVRPNLKYNWLTTELITWKQFDGSIGQGVLYKPENFDKNKKYPVIFNYYDKMSHRLYEFPYPDFTHNNINIPWFISNGYLVFTPDINHVVAATAGKTTGESVFNSVVSAAKYLSQLPYVNGKKMAIQGHSFGGGLTSYLVTHCSLFAAAAEVAGSNDPISEYLTLIPSENDIEHYSQQLGYEMSQRRYGGTPWQYPEIYRRNSAVLSADNASTPLLIMHNFRDNQINFRQGVELYMALRRLHKKVWMLQYDNGYHSVYGNEASDYTIRLTQFFDYYLKGSPPPRWMTKGIRAEMKGIDNGFESDFDSQP